MDWMLMPLRRYADFSGRSQRQEYWMFQLLNLFVIIVGLVLVFAGFDWAEMAAQSNQYGKFASDAAASPSAPPGPLTWIGGGILLLWVLGTFIPHIAVAVRRFHDQDKSGWFYLLYFIPYAGGIILLVFMCIEGTKGPNQYGEDPKGGSRSDIFA
ncbi:MAG: DUF805 domain-containing protein [Sphingopyxis sp.]